VKNGRITILTEKLEKRNKVTLSVSYSHNLVFDGGSNTSWLLSDIIGVNPNISPLRNNGGSTPTHALLPGSPAIDVGDTTITDSIDQRGFARVQDGNGDDIAVIDTHGKTDVFDAMQDCPWVCYGIFNNHLHCCSGRLVRINITISFMAVCTVI